MVAQVPSVGAAIRRADASDLESLVALAREYCVADHHDFDESRVRTALPPLHADDSVGVVWVTDGSDGYAVVTWGWSLEIGGSEAVLDEIYVRVRGEGTGSRMLAVIEADCRDRGVRRIMLETEAPNEAARRLYARHGYNREPSIWMAKELH
jgi:GNAT superfamily N-acetyltransferase